MSQIETVALVGASGNLGTLLLPLLRQRYRVTVVSRVSSKAEFPDPEELKVVHVSDDYPVGELETLFEGVDAVVCAIAPQSSGVQLNIIEAALAAGVKHYIPAEFGLDTTDPAKGQALPALSHKIQVLDRLRLLDSGAPMSWTGIATGLFFDWGLTTGFLRYDLTTRTAEILGDGFTKFSTTTVPDIAQAVMGVLAQYDGIYRNKYIFVQSLLTDQNQILHSLQRLTGNDWTVNRISEGAFLERAKGKAEAGNVLGERYDQIWRLGILKSNFKEKESFATELLPQRDLAMEIAKVL